jgi:hypothetical protein
MVVASVCLLLLAAVPASAAHVDPHALVLHRADVPNGFELDRDDSGLRSNESEAKGDRRLPGLFRRWGRVTGYEMEFDRRETAATIRSRADLFRTPEGPELMMAYVVEEAKKSGIKGLRRSSVRIGAGGWLYGGGSGAFNLVVWRHRRVFAGLVAFGVQKGRMLALARAQQRRIAAALG